MIEMGDLVLYKANKLIKAQYEANSIQNKAFNFILYSLQQNKNIIPVDEHTSIIHTDISYRYIKQIFKKNISYEDIYGYLQTLSKIPYEIYGTKIKSSSNTLISRILKLDDKNFRIYMFADVFETLMRYKEGYSSLDLEIINNFRSVYSQKLYEQLRMWSGTKKEITFSVEALKFIFRVETKYKNYTDFKKYAVEKAINEINKSKVMDIKYIEEKEGKKVINIVFTIVDNVARSKASKSTDFLIGNNKNVETKMENKKKKLKCANFKEREYDANTLEEALTAHYNS